VITLVILSMLFPGNVSKKLLQDSGLQISDRTLRRIKEDIKDLGVEQLVKDAYKLYLLTTVDSFMDAMKLKQNMFSIVTSTSADNFEKIKAGQVILDVLKQMPELYDPALSESIHTSVDKEHGAQGNNNPAKPELVKNDASDVKHEETGEDKI
ncbi:MAG: hypothetical protein ACREBJ_11150, partial [Nitrosotalea sp.]